MPTLTSQMTFKHPRMTDPVTDCIAISCPNRCGGPTFTSCFLGHDLDAGSRGTGRGERTELGHVGLVLLGGEIVPAGITP